MCSYTYSWYYCNHDYYICKYISYFQLHSETTANTSVYRVSLRPSTHTAIDNHGPTSTRANSLEICEHRVLSGYSYDAWSVDLCKNMKVSCGGFSNYYCTECSEDVSLEFELDEL